MDRKDLAVNNIPPVMCFTGVGMNDFYMRAIANVADVLFKPSLTSPDYTGMFADGQKVTFNPNTVDWEQLERTCRFWSRAHLIREFTKFVTDFNNDRLAKKIILGAVYGVLAVNKD